MSNINIIEELRQSFDTCYLRDRSILNYYYNVQLKWNISTNVDKKYNSFIEYPGI